MKIRSIVSIVSLAVLAVFIVQNFTTTRLSFLVWEISLPRSFLFLLLFALGFLTGMAYRGMRR